MRATRLAAGLVGAVVLLRACGGEPYRIPSDSMAATLLPGDHVLVEKATFGAQWPVLRRLPGLRTVARGDVVVFRAPFSAAPDGRRLIKRVVGLPGDTVALQAGAVLVNGRPLLPPATALLSWRDCTGARVEGTARWAQQRRPADCPLTLAQTERGTLSLGTFPEGTGNSATDVSPLRVPRRGDTLELDLHSWPRVRDVLRHEGHTAQLLPGGTVLLDGKETARYVVRDQYYYVLGDHRGASSDSRAWGFVPGRLIVGRAALIHYSADTLTGRARWNRVGLRIR